VFESRVLIIFGPKRKEIVGGWKKMHNEELHNLYFSPDSTIMIKLRRIRWVWHVGRMVNMRNIREVLV
jgi:hypothetical protein